MKLWQMLVSIFLVIMIVSLIFGKGWIIYHDRPYKGKVVDAETKQPIEGVAVVAIWYVQQSALGAGPIAKFLNAKEAITDKNGNFVIPSMFGFNLWPGFLNDPNLIVFKPGYKKFEDRLSNHKRIVIMIAQTKTVKERMESVSSLDVCGTMSDERCIKKLPYMLNLRGKERTDIAHIK